MASKDVCDGRQHRAAARTGADPCGYGDTSGTIPAGAQASPTPTGDPIAAVREADSIAVLLPADVRTSGALRRLPRGHRPEGQGCRHLLRRRRHPLQGLIAATTKKDSGPVKPLADALNETILNGTYARVPEHSGLYDEAVTKSEINPPRPPKTNK